MANSLKPPSLGSTLGSTLGKSPAQPKDLSKIGKQGTAVKPQKCLNLPMLLPLLLFSLSRNLMNLSIRI